MSVDVSLRSEKRISVDWGAILPPDFARSLNPISTWGQIVPTTSLPPPSGFSYLPMALH